MRVSAHAASGIDDSILNNLTAKTLTSSVKTNRYHQPGSLLRAAVIPLAILPAALIMPACNKESDDEPEQTTTAANINSVAVTSFSLQSDNSVMRGLDSVFFSIDSKTGIIFNADSLPKGTDIKKLKTKIQFYNSISDAEYTMTNGSHRTGTSNYRTSPNDTIDFTGDVHLTVVSLDGNHSLTYRVKVNVHQMDPDSLAWGETAVATLPSRLSSPRDQKTVSLADGALCLVEEADGTFTASTISKTSAVWDKKKTTFPSKPDIRTLCATSDAVYLLDADGNLIKSADSGSTWSATGIKWIAITGGYDNFILGVAGGQEGIRHTHYPASSTLKESPLEPGFPLSGTAGFHTFVNRWAPLPTGILCGGEDSDGTLTGATWAFDGSKWCDISETPLPPVTGATMFPYYAFRKTSTKWELTEFSVWLLIGGRLSDGSLNRKTYISYDNGIHWREASSQLTLPDFIPPVAFPDALVSTVEMTGSLSGWSRLPAPRIPVGARLKYDTDGETVTWECPYIYLFGGIKADGQLSPYVWRGALNRLTFRPIF